MERRFVVFLVLSFGILLGHYWLMQKIHPPARRDQAAEKQPGEEAKDLSENQPVGQPPSAVEGDSSRPGSAVPRQSEKAPAAIQPLPEPESPEQWIALGSADRTDPYRMLVTLTNKGAAVARIELNSPRYCDIDDRNGYLGHPRIEPSADGHGCLVQMVGPGTPAAEAGLEPGDVITALNRKPVADQADIEAVLAKTKPKQPAELEIVRKGERKLLTASLRRRPLEVIRPEGDDPLSMLLTLQQFGDEKLSVERPEKTADEQKNEKLHDAYIDRELEGVRLRTANWQIVSSDPTHAQFRRLLPEKGLEITKTYRLAKVPEAEEQNADFPAYHLEFEIEIRNVGGEARKVAYRLDGPNGLPTEGAWYAYKVSRNWGGAGLRDFVISFDHGTPGMVGAPTIAEGKDIPPPWNETNKKLTFIGVDAQYFSAVLMPLRGSPNETWFDELTPIRLGRVDPKETKLTNTSCRLIGAVRELKPGESIQNQFRFFTGPKKPAILENKEYQLGELIYYGWPIFAIVAKPLAVVLHWFYAVAHNYGLAILMLTILVRGCMFPLSLKQVAGAQKMQRLQPEIKKIQEKHKGNVEARTKAQQDLFRKHNYNPLSGCLPIFIQMPVFLGLYRALSVSIELRDAPLISNAIRWCSNLAAPDMLYDWSWFMPEWVNGGVGIFGLGPYFNLLPILTIFLFIGQQKVLMPPPADEQAAMQQKVMQYMMIFMGLLFFKVASGLCVYFIVSSLWGLGERQFLPKAPPPAGADPETRAEAKARERSNAKNKK